MNGDDDGFWAWLLGHNSRDGGVCNNVDRDKDIKVGSVVYLLDGPVGWTWLMA